MRKYQLSFFEIDSDRSLQQIADALGAKFIDDSIQLPERGGRLKRMLLEDGLSIRTWDLLPGDELLIEKIPYAPAATGKVFQIVHVLQAEKFSFKSEVFQNQRRFPPGMDTLFFSNDATLDIGLPAGCRFQAVDISVSFSWLMEAFGQEALPVAAVLKQVNEKAHPTVFLESSSPAEHRVFAGLHSGCMNGSMSRLQIKADVLAFLSGFFGKVFTHTPEQNRQNCIYDYEKMLAVEKILKEHLDKTLPAIEKIASSVAMSESTLKRHFKQVFEKSIYHYYLEMKMDYAKKVLTEKAMTVCQVAALLEYDKVSNFIIMFKKKHGLSPGRLLRNVQLAGS